MNLRCATLLTFAFFLPSVALAEADVGRDSHVFLSDEAVRIAVPDEPGEAVARVRLMDEHLALVTEAVAAEGEANLGLLPVGWYRVAFLNSDGAELVFTTAAVLEPLAVSPPVDTPIALDVALAWLGAEDQGDWPMYARLARLAGVRWVRDRIHWREVQGEDGAFAAHTKYDDSAAIQAAEGLQILQVFHTRPRWASAPGSNPERPRLDLIKLYAFCKGLAERFHGQVQAWEPWNEGNAANFGGYTIDELCTIQKAAYLGFKAGDAGVTVGWNPLGGINIESQTRSILENETWPYYDTYNIHSYDWPHGYEGLWEHAREAACGKPIWVTECDRGMQAAPDSEMGDFTAEYDLRKAELIVQSVVRSLFAGSSRHFHFILGHYMEGENRVQFGLLRKDLTPRPGYVALAGLGRLLAGGVCLGRHEIEGQPNVHVYGFRARPQGETKDVIVAWTEREVDWPERGQERAAWPIAEPIAVEAVYDYLGRHVGVNVPDVLRPDPVFLVLPEGESEKLEWRKVPSSELREGTASPVVLQFDAGDVLPVQRTMGWSPEAAYEFAAGTTVDGSITVYNLGETRIAGEVTLADLPVGWHCDDLLWPLEMEPLSEVTIPVRLRIADDAETGNVWLKFRGAFGVGGEPCLSVWSRKPPEE